MDEYTLVPLVYILDQTKIYMTKVCASADLDLST